MNLSKKSSFAAAILLAIAVSYIIGFKSGSFSAPVQTPASNIVGQEAGIPGNVDFSAFWKAWNIIDSEYVGTSTTDQERVWGAIKGMTESLGDPYTVFFPPAESKMFASEVAGNFEGVGMEIGIKNGKLVVVAPLKDTPAEKAGIKAGDYITKINTTEASELSTDEAIKLIRGKAGTTVKLVLTRDGMKDPLTISVTRAQIDIPTIKTEKKDGVFIISLYSFSANSANLFRNALKEFISSGTNKLIIDLRGNPGGYLDAAVDMASWFLPSGKVVVREELGKLGEEHLYRSKGYNIFNSNLKLVILVDKGSASAAEILAGALSENGVGKLVGIKTFGKGSVQELVTITPETSLKVTIAKWLTPNGKWISKEGIAPDYVVPISEEDVKNKKDPQLDKAIELLSKQP